MVRAVGLQADERAAARTSGVISKVTAVWEAGCLLGEGPVWLLREQQLRFVDIKAGRVFGFSPGTGDLLVVQTGGEPSFLVTAADGGQIAGSRNELLRFDAETGFGVVLAHIPEPAGNRTNDATVDDRGRLWFGTMDDNQTAPSGAVWCLDKGVLHRAGPTAVVTNGPAVSVDGTWLYHVDSGARTIWRFPLGDAPVLKNGTVFVQLTEADGFPDGVVIDAEDCLWVALWDGWAVRRYAPDGTLLLHIPMPCARPTKVAFGGPDLTTAYVTSARVGLSEAQLASQPLAGSLFAFAAPAPGRVLPEVLLS